MIRFSCPGGVRPVHRGAQKPAHPDSVLLRSSNATLGISKKSIKGALLQVQSIICNN